MRTNDNVYFSIGNFIQNGINREPIVVKGDGTTVRSYLDADDMAEWLWTILLKGNTGEAYNVGSDSSISIKDLAHLVSSCFPTKPEVLIKGKPSDKVDYYVPDISKIKHNLDVEIKIQLNDNKIASYDVIPDQGNSRIEYYIKLRIVSREISKKKYNMLLLATDCQIIDRNLIGIVKKFQNSNVVLISTQNICWRYLAAYYNEKYNNSGFTHKMKKFRNKVRNEKLINIGIKLIFFVIYRIKNKYKLFYRKYNLMRYWNYHILPFVFLRKTFINKSCLLNPK